MAPDQKADRASGFAGALRAQRLAAGMTQVELAGQAGVGVRTVRDLEHGHTTRPQRTTVELLADGLGLTGEDRAGFMSSARGSIPGQRTAPPGGGAGGEPGGPTRDLKNVPDAGPVALGAVALRAKAVGAEMAGAVAAGQAPPLVAWHATTPLPPPPKLIGRNRDLADLAELLIAGGDRAADGAAKLVTLVGLAGVGKSTLALAAVHRVAERFAGGVAGVTISEMATQSDVLAAVASVFQVGPAADLACRFANGPGLLLVDAVERAPASTAAALSWLASVAPALCVLATGRHPVELPGELVWPVLPLEEPPPDVPAELETVAAYPAAQLFLARLRPLRREPVDQCEIDSLVSLVRRLGGLPLALELAAGWGRVLDLNEILHRYGDHVLDLGAAPASSAGAVAQRSAVTLRDAVAASYHLLDPAERYALRMLAVFNNRWSIELAEAILTDAGELGGGPTGGDPVPLLDRLIALGLIGVRGTGPYRLRLLDVVRDFALEQAAAAGDLGEARRRHARIFARFVGTVARELVGGGQLWAATQLDEVASDLWAAVAYAAEHDPPTALALAARLTRWWRFHGRDVPGRRWLRQLLDDPRTAGASPRLRAWAKVGVAQLAHEHGAGQQELRAAIEALAEFQRLEDLHGELAARGLLCALLMASGGYDQARDLAAARRRLAAGDRLAAQCGDPRLRALARANLAEVARLEGRYGEAVARGRRAAALLRELGDPAQRRRALGTVGLALAQAGRVEEAGCVLLELRSLALPSSEDDGLSASIEGTIALHQGDPELAVEWFTAAADAEAARTEPPASPQVRPSSTPPAPNPPWCPPGAED